MNHPGARFPIWLLLTGALQGGVLWWLWHLRQAGQWPFTQPVAQMALVYAALATPLAVYATQAVDGLPRSVRRLAVLGYLGVFAGLGGWAAWAAGAEGKALAARPQDVVAACVLGFVSLGLLCGYDFAARRWRYTRLFYYSWRNGIVLATAAAMAAAVWVVLWAGAELMRLIGVRWVGTLLDQPVFIFPVSGLVVAAAVALGIARAEMTETIRRFWLSIAAWLLPLVLFFAVVWVLTAPLTTLEPLFKTRNAAFMLLWFTALAVKFANCAYQDGEAGRPYPAWLARATQVAWLGVLPVVGIACWALGLRVVQYGWSEQRLWAALVAVLALVYAVGYAVSWRQPGRWMAAIARTNIAAAVLLCAVLLAVLTPIAPVQRLAVSAHLRHVQQAGQAQGPDWHYLRWGSGRFGREALQQMATDPARPPDWAQQAREMLARTQPYDTTPPKLPPESVARHLVVHPAGRSLPATFVADALAEKAYVFQDCVDGPDPCHAWLGDLTGDGVDEVVLFDSSGYDGSAVYVLTQGAWQARGELAAEFARDSEGFHPDQLDAARTATSPWKDLLVGTQRWYWRP
nr:DUF4153 domain-containing protein [uncultured Albidiferax sp.]